MLIPSLVTARRSAGLRNFHENPILAKISKTLPNLQELLSSKMNPDSNISLFCLSLPGGNALDFRDMDGATD